MGLSERDCEPCRGGVPALSAPEQTRLHAELDPSWQRVEGHHLFRRYTFPDFRAAWAHLERIAQLAEAVGHHPDLLLAWGRLEVTIYTHAIDGLTEADFILAAKIDRLEA